MARLPNISCLRGAIIRKLPAADDDITTLYDTGVASPVWQRARSCWAAASTAVAAELVHHTQQHQQQQQQQQLNMQPGASRSLL
jgi:hypothetical protein